MFHLKPKPSPPRYVGRETPGQAVDSSAVEITPGLARVQRLVQLLEERDRVEVLVPAEHVRHPLAGLARVVEVEHRGDGVDADPVGVVLAQPVERVREQEVPHLRPAEVEDERAPVGMRAAARVGVLVQVRPVEGGERPVVAREVRRHPVEDHADAALVQAVDEVAEVVGRAEARGRRVVAGHLVAPRAGERMLHHRQQLDVREAEVGDVVGELVGELAVASAGGSPRAGCAATSRGAPRRSRAGRAAGRRRRGARATPRRARRASPPRRPTRSPAAPRCGRRAGRSSGAGGRPASGSRTCTSPPPRRRGRTAPRSRTRRASASGAGARPRS